MIFSQIAGIRRDGCALHLLPCGESRVPQVRPLVGLTWAEPNLGGAKPGQS